LETLRQAQGKVSQATYMDNQLREFEEFFLDNALLKVHNQTLMDKNLKQKESWQIIQEIIKEQIQDSLKIVCSDEVYLNELVTY
jgi:hypothetical protein